MFKRILIGILGAIIVVALAVSAYTAFASPGTNPIAATDPITAGYGSGNGGNANQDPTVGQGQVGNGYQGGNGQGNGGQVNPVANGSGAPQPQADITGATIVHGIVNAFEITGMSVTLDDGTTLYVQLGGSRYTQSIGFAPAAGEGVTVNGFSGDQALYSAISVTLDSTGQVYSFRDASGRPLWAGGNGNGNGGRP
ncbi:MAG: hypothetical protein AB1649_25855 [Chloroflexota bacterium]